MKKLLMFAGILIFTMMFSSYLYAEEHACKKGCSMKGDEKECPMKKWDKRRGPRHRMAFSEEHMEELKKHDPEQFERLEKIQAMRKEIRQHVMTYRKGSDQEKKELEPQIKKMMGEVFDLREKSFEKRLDKMSEKIKSMQERLKVREEKKAEIISRHFKSMSGQEDHLRWRVPEFEGMEGFGKGKGRKGFKHEGGKPEGPWGDKEMFGGPGGPRGPRGDREMFGGPGCPDGPKGDREMFEGHGGPRGKKHGPPTEEEKKEMEERHKKHLEELKQKDPEAYKAIIEKESLHKQIYEQIKLYREAKDDNAKAEIEKKVMPLLEKMFVMRTAEFKKKSDMMSEKMKKFRDLHEKRLKSKDEIIIRFFDRITGKDDFMKW